MSWKFVSIHLAAAALLLAGCNPPATATIPPSPVPLSVSYSPYLARIQDALHACALSLPESAIFFDQTPGSEQEFMEHDLVIWWGDKPAAVDYAYALNQDDLVVILNPENPKQELSKQELNALFSGRIERWTDIGTLDQLTAIWIYPEGNLLSEVFKLEILAGSGYTSLASVAPSPQAMLEAVESTPGAIGFLPRAWISQEVSVIEIEPALQSKLNRPLLALTKTEPKAELQALLACLQTGAGQAILAEDYEQPR